MTKRKTCWLFPRPVSFLFPSTVQKVFCFLVVFFSLCSRAAEIDAEKKATDLTELPLEALMEIEVPTVYGASKFEQKMTAAPSSISVVTADEIKRYGYRTLGDVLQSVQGFHVSYDRNYAFLGSRGVNLGDFNSRILLLIDGHRLNNNLTDGAFIETAFLLDIDLIDRVEIIRGPGSVLYGNNAFFGVVNVITRKGRQAQNAEVSGEYARHDTYKGRVTLGRVFTNGFEFLLSGTLYDSEGPDRLFYKEFNTPSQNNGIAEDLDDDSFGSFFGSLAYQDFTLQGGFISREKGNPTAQFFTAFNDPRLRTIDDRGYVNLKYSHSFPEVVDVTAQVYYDRNDFQIGYPVTTPPSGTTFFKEKDRGEWWGCELQLNKRFWERHIVTLGAEYRDDFRQERRISQGSTIFTDVHRSRQSHGVYVQGDLMVVTNLHFSGGVRYDQYGDFDPTFNPRLALVYNPCAKSTVKAIYGTAFRAPNFLELSDPQFQDIRPEEITSYELVYEQEIGTYLRSSVSGFYNRMDDLIVFESGNFRNIDAETRGTELALEGFWTSGLRTRLSYTFQETDNQTTNLEFPDSPGHLVKANLSMPLYKEKVFAGLEFQYASKRHTLDNTTDSGGQPLTVQGEDAGGFGIVNATLFSQNLVKNLELSASIYNLLDRNYGDPATRFHQQDVIERDGRSFRLKLTYRF
jgi:outer membrane receptor for ferrienterochelin and colicins